MNIVYYTAGLSGSGNLVRGLSIANALLRNKIECTYTIVNSSPASYLLESMNVRHIEIPVEQSSQLTKRSYKTSALFNTLQELHPDILIVAIQWFPLHHFIQELTCKKIYLCRQIDDSAFTIPGKEETLTFDPGRFDLCLKIEPFESTFLKDEINPFIIRNIDEVRSREESRTALGITGVKPVCFLTATGYPGEFENIKKTYSSLEETYEMVYTTNDGNGIFPIVDYFSAADLIVSEAGYNAFWEAVYFEKEAIFIPVKRRFEDPHLRVENYQDYSFTKNGADQLVELMLG